MLCTTYFVDIMQLDDVIEQIVEVVEERDHLHGRADGAHGGEAHYIREKDGHHFVALRLHRLPRHQLFCNIPVMERQHRRG